MLHVPFLGKVRVLGPEVKNNTMRENKETIYSVMKRIQS